MKKRSKLTKLKHFLKYLKILSYYNLVIVKNNNKAFTRLRFNERGMIMNKNDQEFLVQKIRTQYTEKENTRLDELKELDKKVKMPANVFAYIFGSISVIVMGSGMSLTMTEIGQSIGVKNPMVPGVVIGAAGMLMAIINYPIYSRILRSRRNKYADKIIDLSDKIMKG